MGNHHVFSGRRIWTICVVALLALTGSLMLACSGPRLGGRYDVAQVRKALSGPEKPGLNMGEFDLADGEAIIDGDTIRVRGLRSTLRLLSIDTEETFKREEERALYAKGWEHYLNHHKEQSRGPVKIATPLGEDAKKFAKKFFKGVTRVKLERDHPKEIKGRYNRFLTYAFVKRDGKWVNYNVECVRAGMTPYYAKYSYSRRFHDEFVVAQAEARKAGLGIWKAGGEHYDDYDKRLAWWNSRGDFIRDFENEAKKHPNYIVLTNFDALQRIHAHLGKEVVILATPGKVKVRKKGPTTVSLSRRRGGDFPLIFFKKDVLAKSRIGKARGEYLRVRGKITEYKSKYRKRSQLQIIVNKPEQVILPTNNPRLNSRLAAEGEKP